MNKAVLGRRVLIEQVQRNKSGQYHKASSIFKHTDPTVADLSIVALLLRLISKDHAGALADIRLLTALCSSTKSVLRSIALRCLCLC